MGLRILVGVLIVAAMGCGGKQFAPVSGKVTLNGKPLPHATVMLQPIGQPGSLEAGEGSAGKTNEQGEYRLQSSTGKTGALVGKHKVSISASSVQAGEHDTRPPRGGWPQADKVPDRYNSKTELTLEVPSGGTDKANFDLTAP